MDRLQSMRVFQQVVDEGGFAAAARKLDLTPAAVTRLVAMRLMDPTQQDHELEIEIPAAVSANHTDVLLRATIDAGGISSQSAD